MRKKPRGPKYRNLVAILAAWSLVCLAAVGSASPEDSIRKRWSHYQPAHLDFLLDVVERDFKRRPQAHVSSGGKFRVRAKGYSVTRDIPPTTREFVAFWADHWKLGAELQTQITRVAFVKTEKRSLWLPIQDRIVAAFEQAMPGRPVDLYIMLLGITASGEGVFIINAFEENPPD